MYGGMFWILLVIVSLFLITNIRNAYVQNARRELDQTADKVKEHIESGGMITTVALDELNPNKYVEIAVFQTDSDRRIFDSHALPNPFGSDLPKPGKSEDTVIIRAIRYMTSERIAKWDGQLFLIRVFRNFEREQDILKLFTTLFTAFNISGVIMAFFIGSTISRLTLKPVRKIIHAANRIGIEDLSKRIDITGPNDELRELSLAFNAMISRLEISFRQQGKFVSDASHELRTPISVIQGYANLLDRWGKNDPVILQESIDSLKAETEHMTMLIKKLLMMAKAEQGKLQIVRMPIDCNSIAEDVIKEMELVERHWNVELESSANTHIMGDYDLIKQLFWILLENAVKYSKETDGKILVRIFEQSEKICVTVKDEGIGISSEDLPYIFDRFYRADKSRSNDVRLVKGTGLGLSIAAWIIKQHEAEATVNSTLGEGTEFIIRFPMVS
jgi:signal transduction histidine kinase